MGILDVVSKTILNQGPQDLIRLACPNLEVRSLLSLEKEFVSVQRNADKLFQVQREAEEEPLFLHIEVNAQWESNLPQRMLEYWALFSNKHPKLDSVLIVLQDNPSKGQPKASLCVTTALGKRLSFEYSLLCIWEIEAEELWILGSPHLLPLLPLPDIYIVPSAAVIKARETTIWPRLRCSYYPDRTPLLGFNQIVVSSRFDALASTER